MRHQQALTRLDMTYFYNILTYTGKSLTSQGTDLLLYKRLEGELGDSFDGSVYPLTEEAECIYMAAQSEDALPDMGTIQKMVLWGRRRGLKAEDRVYSNNMTTFFSREKVTYVWSCTYRSESLNRQENQSVRSGCSPEPTGLTVQALPPVRLRHT